ncbi:hypothetical protein [Sphingomonas sp. UYEF23]|uniref:hypothetical protein n=1 Tax=Sphingomonas sp. UYEF23 TaxID=1756408 RepID=UPI0033923891
MITAVTRLAALRAFTAQDAGEGKANRVIELLRALGDMQSASACWSSPGSHASAACSIAGFRG